MESRRGSYSGLWTQIPSFSHSASLRPDPPDPALTHHDLPRLLTPWHRRPPRVPASEPPSPFSAQGRNEPTLPLPYSPTAPCCRSAGASVASSGREPAAGRNSVPAHCRPGGLREGRFETGRGGETVRHRSGHARLPGVPPWRGGACPSLGVAHVSTNPLSLR